MRGRQRETCEGRAETGTNRRGTADAPLPHPELCGDGFPVSLSVSPADLLQLLHLLLTPLRLVDGRVEEVLPETADVLRVPRSFKLRRKRGGVEVFIERVSDLLID